MKGFVKTYAGTLLVTWVLIIFVLCATPGKYIPNVSWLELLSFDKFVHAGMFFVLCSLSFIYAIKKMQARTLVLLYVFGAIAYGALLEFMQARFFIDRSADWLDITANTFGCLLALSLFKKIRQLFYTT